MCTVKPKAPKKQCMSVVYAMELVKENLIKMTRGTITNERNKERTRGLRKDNAPYHKDRVKKIIRSPVKDN